MVTGFRKLKLPDLKSMSLVDVTVLLALAVLIFTHLPPALESHLVRQQVIAALPLAASAQALVGGKALEGVAFDVRDVPMTLERGAAIEVAATTGIITLTFSKIDGGGKSLKLIPMIRVGEGLLPLPEANEAGANTWLGIVWICTSSLTRSRDPYIMANRGTLKTKYSPDSCRHQATSAKL